MIAAAPGQNTAAIRSSISISQIFATPKSSGPPTPSTGLWLFRFRSNTKSCSKSANLKQWKHLSEFGPAGATGGAWECPELFQLPLDGKTEQRWVLKVGINPGAVAGGSGEQYFIGNFDGQKFTNDNPTSTTSGPTTAKTAIVRSPIAICQRPRPRSCWVGWPTGNTRKICPPRPSGAR